METETMKIRKVVKEDNPKIELMATKVDPFRCEGCYAMVYIKCAYCPYCGCEFADNEEEEDEEELIGEGNI